MVNNKVFSSNSSIESLEKIHAMLPSRFLTCSSIGSTFFPANNVWNLDFSVGKYLEGYMSSSR